MNKLKICKYCASWQPDGDRESSRAGECRRRAPNNVVDITEGYRGWLRVLNTDWCREFTMFTGDE